MTDRRLVEALVEQVQGTPLYAEDGLHLFYVLEAALDDAESRGYARGYEHGRDI